MVREKISNKIILSLILLVILVTQVTTAKSIEWKISDIPKITDIEDNPYFVFVDSDGILKYGISNKTIGEIKPGNKEFIEKQSIAVDNNGVFHIAYYLYSRGHTYASLEYVSGNNTKGEEIDRVTAASRTSIGVDTQGKVHIVYSEDENHMIKYAVFNGSMWKLQDIDIGHVMNIEDTYGSKFMKLDSNGLPGIAYQSRGDWKLRYAKYDGYKWNIQNIPYDNVIRAASITFYEKDKPQITFIDDKSNKTMYAYIIDDTDTNQIPEFPTVAMPVITAFLLIFLLVIIKRK